jgi:hydroxymethylpyrimidine/phosphomethylpyrimidine kinase
MRPSVLIFAGSDPGGGAGLQADMQAVATFGAHPLTVVTALTVQDNDRVYDVQPVAADMVQRQAQALIDKIEIAGVKIGIVGSRANAEAIAGLIAALRQRNPRLPVVLDTVLASGHGDALSKDDAVQAIQPLLPLASIVTPNLPEAARLCSGETHIDAQADMLLRHCDNVLIKGGHGSGANVLNSWFSKDQHRTWSWPRLAGEFHGTGCTLASAIAALLARGKPMAEALDAAQAYCHQALLSAYAIADGQRIPERRIFIEDVA